MSPSSAENYLADRRYVSVVVRLVLDQRGHMIHGEVVGAANTQPTRFSGWPGLNRAIRAWLAQPERDADSDDSPPSTAVT